MSFNTIVFWQDQESIHQTAIIRALSSHIDVHLVLQSEITKSRRHQGWAMPDYGDAIVHKKIDKLKVEKILKEENTVSVFSGFQWPDIYKYAWDLSLKRGHGLFIQNEPFNYFGWKGLFRRFRFKRFIKQVKDQITGVLAISSISYRQYKETVLPSSMIYNWAYFTESPPFIKQLDFGEKKCTKPSLIYIGQLIDRKNIPLLLSTANRLRKDYSHFTIIGNGPLSNKVEIAIGCNPKIKWIKRVPNTYIPDYIAKHDLLVLPSHFDGWGAVTNEALQSGTPVIISEFCGSSDLIDGVLRGDVFELSGSNDFETVLKRWLLKGAVSSHTRSEIQFWSKEHISGKAGAEYLIEIINHALDKSSTMPVAPWLKKK